MKLAIIADDLTGALDTSVPFVAAGLSVAVAVTPAGLEAARARRPDVLVVNTASRAMDPHAAAELVHGVAERFGPDRPEIVLKKVDSRLKGNVGAETAALAEVTGAMRVLVAPAIPDQGRPTRNGAVTGAGVPEPIAIAPLFGLSTVPLEVADAESDAELDRVAASIGEGTLVVGARGIGLALARRLGRPSIPLAFTTDAMTLFGFGSRDPITMGQIAELARLRPDVPIVELPHGAPHGPVPQQLPLLLRCTGEQQGDPGVVAERLAATVRDLIGATHPGTLILGGGDTALAVLRALEVEVVSPLGEAAPGVPMVEIAISGATIRCLVKSGGFGEPDVLARLLGERPW